ncbi:MAG: AAA family ATPase [Chthonomonadales bacterium]
MTDQDLQEIENEVEEFRRSYHAIREQIRKVIVGHEDVIEGVLTCLVAGGHALLEGVPGLGKTLLVRTLAEAVNLTFSRIQFTPDLMPADICGTNILVEVPGGGKEFRFQPGPVFAQIILADEINRATPKTQSAMLEAMQEHAVTAAGVRRPLQEPFFVMATQNPIEMEGTYPLPEAQLDRFFFKLIVRSPGIEELRAIVERTTGTQEQHAHPVADGAAILRMRQLARRVPVASHVMEYALSLVRGTHPDAEIAPEAVKRYVRYGSSPRGAQALVLAAKMRSLIAGRFNAAVEDVTEAAQPALRHRIILNFEGEAEGVSADELIKGLVDRLVAAYQGMASL